MSREELSNKYTELSNKYTDLTGKNSELKNSYLDSINQNSGLIDQIEELEIKNNSLQSQLDNILKLIKGFKSERFIPDTLDTAQGNLFGESMVEPELIKQEVAEHTRIKKKHPGREAFPAHLAVEEIILNPEIDLESGDHQRMGEEVTETLHYKKAELKIIRCIRPRYVKKNTEQILIADLPSRPVPKCRAEISLIVQLMIAKFVDHLPFYRQRQIFKRDFKWKVSDSTLNSWYTAHVEVLRPIYYLILDKIMAEGYIQADETPLKVLDKTKIKTTHKGYMWVYHAPQLSYVFFDYRKGRGMHGPKEMLRSFTGYLQCDGYKVYDKFGKKSGITLVGCLAHLRRKFVDALDYDEATAGYALEQIQKIYLLDRAENNLTKRSEQKEVWDALLAWAIQQGQIILPKSPLGKALGYLIGQREKLSAIFSEDKLKLDNNLIENKIRPLALGRKNFLFAGSHDGAERIAIMQTLLGTCKALGVDPRLYLETLLDRISDQPINKLEELLPDNIKM